MTAPHELRTLQGHIASLPLSGGGETARVALVTDDETEYHVLYKAAGVDLTDHIGARAEVTGVIAALPVEEDVQKYTILVRSYRLTDGFADAWYDDADD